MFRHQGKSRTFQHNLRIATILSFVAGIVNASGFLEFQQLTTNVTGHFALFINDITHLDLWKGTVYFLYIGSFLIGSFSSGFLIEMFRENKRLNVFVLPTVIECLVLIAVPLVTYHSKLVNTDLMVCTLLFAMGLQNSFVTKISNAVVRTTHLTGLFTDLGIELSQLLFPKTPSQQQQIKSAIRLRISIISFFFLGGITGGFFYLSLGLKLYTLILGAVLLMLSLFFDDFRFRFIKMKRRYGR